MKSVKTSRKNGFTLIEIMVALAIGAVVIGGISQVYISFQQTNKVSFALSRLQESARLATDTMLQDISMIGFLGCLDPMLSDPEINVIYTNAPSWIDNFRRDSLMGWDVTQTAWGDTVGLGNIDGTANKNAIMNSDVIRAQFLSRSRLDLTAAMTNSSSNIGVNSNIFGLTSGDVAAIGDCQKVDIFKITGVGSSPITFSHSASGNDSDDLSGTYNDVTNTKVRIVLNNTYFVGKTGRTNATGDDVYALYRYDRDDVTEEIIEGVENMQVLYGEEISVDPCDDTSNQIRYVSATDAADMSRVSVIKIGLLLASTERVLTKSDTTTYQVLDQNIANTGTTITYADDRRLRKAINMTVNIRNRRTTEECVL